MSVKNTLSGTTSAATLMHAGQALQLPVRSGTIGPDVIDIANLYTEDGLLHLRPGLYLDGELRVEDHLHRRRQGRPALSRLPDRAARRKREFYRDLLPAALRRAADQASSETFRQHASRATRWCTSR